MTLDRMPARWLPGILGALALLLLACGEKEYAPSDCLRSRLPTGYLTVKLTINSQNPEVPITVYLGDFEDGQVVARRICDVAVTLFELPVDKYYSVTARYLVGADTTVVLDGDRIRTSSTEYIDGECWSVEDGAADVRLR